MMNVLFDNRQDSFVVSENLKAELNNFLYIMIGAALFF